MRRLRWLEVLVLTLAPLVCGAALHELEADAVAPLLLLSASDLCALPPGAEAAPGAAAGVLFRALPSTGSTEVA